MFLFTLVVGALADLTLFMLAALAYKLVPFVLGRLGS